jgi:hypothetical protein
MALTTSITTDGDLTAPNAYLRVSDMQIIKQTDGYMLAFAVAFYASATAVSEGKDAICPPRQFQNVAYDPSGPSPIPHVVAYDHLKANVWPDATDC